VHLGDDGARTPHQRDLVRVLAQDHAGAAR
jgi:hypothetical protein